MSLNGYPGYVRNKIIKSLENKKNTKNTDIFEQENIVTTFCRIPYAGVQGKKLTENLVKNIKRHIGEQFILRNIYRAKKLSYYCNTKDKGPEHLKSHIVYEFFCLACNSRCFGKTDEISAPAFKSIMVQTKSHQFANLCWNVNIFITC